LPAACAEYVVSRRLFGELESTGKLTKLDEGYMQRLANARFAHSCAKAAQRDELKIIH
jgi:hypothetical protein